MCYINNNHSLLKNCCESSGKFNMEYGSAYILLTILIKFNLKLKVQQKHQSMFPWKPGQLLSFAIHYLTTTCKYNNGIALLLKLVQNENM
jgi:hypothetical protein